MPMKLDIESADSEDVDSTFTVSAISISSKAATIFYYDEGTYKNLTLAIKEGTKMTITVLPS